MTRDDERKLYEAYATLNKLLNEEPYRIKMEEIKDIVNIFHEKVASLFRLAITSPTLLGLAQECFDKFCKDFIKRYEK